MSSTCNYGCVLPHWVWITHIKIRKDLDHQIKEELTNPLFFICAVSPHSLTACSLLASSLQHWSFTWGGAERKKVRRNNIGGRFPCSVLSQPALSKIAWMRSRVMAHNLSPFAVATARAFQASKVLFSWFHSKSKIIFKGRGAGGRKDVNLSLRAKALAACLPRSLALSIYVLCTLSCCWINAHISQGPSDSPVN